VKAGFSFVELLVALAVASTSLAAIAHSAVSMQIGRRQSEAREAAARLAERRLEQQLARAGAELDDNDTSETVVEATGTLVARTLVEDGPRENLRHVAVTVTPLSGGAPIRLHTFVRVERSRP